jgi:hypothetical protein
MRASTLCRCFLIAIFAALAPVSRAEDKKADDKKDDKKPPAVVLPKDSKTVVLTYDPGAGGFVRKGEAPYLKIQADGAVTVVNLFDGTKKEGKLTAKELDELLKFVIQEKDFTSVTAAKIDAGIKDAAAASGKFIAVGGAGTSVIMVENDGKKHEVSFRGAGAYLGAYPMVDPLARFVAVEKKLSDLATSVAKGK